jgi:uncharacterized membrane protein
MSWYQLSIIVHLLAMCFWFGHMFFWTLVIGPVTNRMTPPESGQTLRQVSLRLGGLGWPALGIFIVTGALMLNFRGFGLTEVVSGELFTTPFGRLLGMKFLLIAWMIFYQFTAGHRPAPRLIYINMAAALTILVLSIFLVRAPGFF